jgi:hypothetical protein
MPIRQVFGGEDGMDDRQELFGDLAAAAFNGPVFDRIIRRDSRHTRASAHAPGPGGHHRLHPRDAGHDG